MPRAASFDVQTSPDATTWTTVIAGRNSSGTTRNPENYDVADRSARYVRIVGHGNSVNAWNSITEVDLYGAGDPPGDPGDPGSRLMFVGDYNTGDFSQWGTCQWRGYNSDCADWNQGSYQARVLNGGPGHETAARFEVRNGDVPPFGGGERSEVSASGISGPTVREGDERWYQFSLNFDQSFQNPQRVWFIVMQWHAGSGSPPLALQVKGDGVLKFTDRSGRSTNIGPIQRGVWVDYMLHVKFSQGSTAYAESWINGQKQPGVHRYPNMASSSNYLKMGIYRDPDETSTAIVWQDGLRITAP